MKLLDLTKMSFWLILGFFLFFFFLILLLGF
jgi:hypothetical protein